MPFNVALMHSSLFENSSCLQISVHFFTLEFTNDNNDSNDMTKMIII